MRLIIRRINGPDINIDVVDDELQTFSVAQLRQRLAEQLSVSDSQYLRLIYCGRVLERDDFLLDQYSLRDGSVIHLIIRQQGAEASQPQSSNTTPSQPPQMEYQRLSNGVIVGSISLVGENAADMLSSLNLNTLLGNATNARFNVINNRNNSASSSSSSQPTATTTRPIESSRVPRADPVIAHRSSFASLQGDDSFTLGIENGQSHLLHLNNLLGTNAGLIPLSEDFGTIEGLHLALHNLMIGLHGIQLPVNSLNMRLAHDQMLSQTSNNRVALIAELNRLSTMLQAVSAATGHLATAFQHVSYASSQNNVQAGDAFSNSNSSGYATNQSINITQPAERISQTHADGTQAHDAINTTESTFAREGFHNEALSDDPTMMVDRTNSDSDHLDYASSHPVTETSDPAINEAISSIIENMQNQLSNLNTQAGNTYRETSSQGSTLGAQQSSSHIPIAAGQRSSGSVPVTALDTTNRFVTSAIAEEPSRVIAHASNTTQTNIPQGTRRAYPLNGSRFLPQLPGPVQGQNFHPFGVHGPQVHGVHAPIMVPYGPFQTIPITGVAVVPGAGSTPTTSVQHIVFPPGTSVPGIIGTGYNPQRSSNNMPPARNPPTTDPQTSRESNNGSTNRNESHPSQSENRDT